MKITPTQFEALESVKKDLEWSAGSHAENGSLGLDSFDHIKIHSSGQYVESFDPEYIYSCARRALENLKKLYG